MTEDPGTAEPESAQSDEEKPPGPTDQGRTGGMATREVAPDLVEKYQEESN